MAQCEVCGNDYEHAFTVTIRNEQHTFDSFECAIAALAPTCARCRVRVLGHGVEAGSAIYCGAHCANIEGVDEARDRA